MTMTPEEFSQRMEMLRKEREDVYMAIIIICLCVFLCTVAIVITLPVPTHAC